MEGTPTTAGMVLPRKIVDPAEGGSERPDANSDMQTLWTRQEIGVFPES